MDRVTGIGGVFFKSTDPKASREWYSKHLGIPSYEYGCMFEWNKANGDEGKGFTVWNPFDQDTKYFDPSQKDYMVNYRVADLEGLLEVLKNEGVEVVGDMQVYDYGKFGWILDPDGNKIELWEPLDSGLEQGETPTIKCH